MRDLISRQAALDAFGLSEKTRKYGGDHSGYDTRMLYEIQDTIESLEPADVVPVRHARWRHYEGMYACEDCGAQLDDESPFCPMCGAKMDSKREE